MSPFTTRITMEIMRATGILITTEEGILRSMMGFGYFFGMEAFYSNPDRNKQNVFHNLQPPEIRQRAETETIGIVPYGNIHKPYPMGIPDAIYMSRLFHELAHATGRAGRLNRTAIMDNDKSRIETGVEELIAEQTSVLLMSHFGLSTSETARYSHDYLEHWLKVIPLEQQEYFMAWAMRESEKAAAYILHYWVVGINFAKEAA